MRNEYVLATKIASKYYAVSKRGNMYHETTQRHERQKVEDMMEFLNNNKELIQKYFDLNG